jgi:hypothetical protein
VRPERRGLLDVPGPFAGLVRGASIYTVTLRGGSPFRSSGSRHNATAPQIHHLKCFAKLLDERGRKQQPPVFAAPTDGNERRLPPDEIAQRAPLFRLPRVAVELRHHRLVFHCLCKSAVVFLLEAGCSDAETGSITGQSAGAKAEVCVFDLADSANLCNRWEGKQRIVLLHRAECRDVE